MTKQHYYHLSSLYLGGPEVILVPRKEGENRGEGEPEVRRICVAPSPEHCMIALGDLLDEKVYVYRTKNKVKGTEPYDVPDAVVTQERWLIRPTKFVLQDTLSLSFHAGIIDIMYGMHFCIGSKEAVPSQRRALKKLQSLRLFNRITNDV